MNQHQKGHLKIFFSYADSIGKTQAMLKAAQTARLQGIHVLVGYMAPHTSPDTLLLLEGLEQLPPLIMEGREEFDLDQALSRRPELILIDELAHSNGKGCRHRRRCQDIDELLKSGIDVYTTVLIGNIESLQDAVASITGITTWERIPDSVFDHADQVELIDIEPQELIQRLQETNTASSQITVEQLTALREIALRRCADRVRRLSEPLRRKNSFHTDEHILACLSSAPSNGTIIRTAARMARAFNSQFTALFVETPDFGVATAENKQRLRDNQRLAEQLGATIEIVYGEDVAYQIAEFARLSSVTKIVLGRSAVTRRHLFGKPSLTDRLLSYAPEVDIHIIPDQSAGRTYRPRRARIRSKYHILLNSLKSVGILSGATGLSLVFYHLGFTNANIIMVYILGVLLTSIAASHQIYSLISSVASVVVFNYLFTDPRFSLTAYEPGYPVTFVVMFLTAYITGTFALRYKKQAGQSAKLAYRTKILFDTDQLLSKAGSREEILNAAAAQIIKLLGRNMVIFEATDSTLSEPRLFSSDTSSPTAIQPPYDPEKELATAKWVLKNNHTAGATTDTLSDSQYLYLALRVRERVYGVVGIEARQNPLDASEYSILLSILSECALALENEKNAREKESAAILAEREQLRANLLRTISHDLRTPLTTISGNASNLISNSSGFDESTKQRLYSDIYNDSMWLIDLVENLLYATRIEEGRMQLQTTTELLSEIIDEALQHIRRKAAAHPLSVVYQDDMLLVKADAKLMVQVIVNIIDNAVKYTPPGASITITQAKSGDLAEIRIADTGRGIPDEEKARLFDMFYCGTNKIADNRRSLGLGLYLCKAIVEAHGGTIHVADNQPHGAVFCFTLPLEEVILHE
ncbi:MAG: sensor histidine kinase KdpD [Lachnospiraceae bacterium]|nr:sensor histidine kinase KdpD [Lachnospiraceae bacterium]